MGNSSNRNLLSWRLEGWGQGVSQDWFLLKAVWGRTCSVPLQASGGLLVISGIFCSLKDPPNFCLYLHMIFSLCVSLSLNVSLYKDISHTSWVVHPTPLWPNFSLLHLQQPYFQRRSNSELRRLGLQHRNFEGTQRYLKKTVQEQCPRHCSASVSLCLCSMPGFPVFPFPFLVNVSRSVSFLLFAFNSPNWDRVTSQYILYIKKNYICKMHNISLKL